MKPIGNHIIAEFISCGCDFLTEQDSIASVVQEGIRHCGLHSINIISHQFQPLGITVIAIISESHVVVHTYPEARHVSIDIFTCSPNPENARCLLDFLRHAFAPQTTRIAQVRRGNPLKLKPSDWIAGFSTTGFEVQYHIQKKICSQRSSYQQIDIIENAHFGKMLFLNNELQVAESDAHLYSAYLTRPLVKSGIPSRHLMILGGSDGSVLSEVLTYHPAHVTLLDFDATAIKFSEKYLTNICHQAFQHPDVTIKTGAIEQLLQSEPCFEAIIYDWTVHPEAFIQIAPEIYLEQLFSIIHKKLQRGGRISLQCGSPYDYAARKLIEKNLRQYFTDIEYSTAFIPSFCENWLFAAARVKK